MSRDRIWAATVLAIVCACLFIGAASVAPDGERVQITNYIPGIHSNGTVIHKFGDNGDIDSGDDEDIWSYGGDYTFMTVASVVYVSSTAAGDTQTYEIQGLDENYDLLTETVTATGKTFKETTGEFLRVFRVKNTGATPNAGVIYVADDNTDAGGDGIPDTAADIKAHIAIGENQTLMALYTVPAGYTAYMTSWFSSMSRKTASAASTVKMYRREVGGVWQVKEVQALHANGTSTFKRDYEAPESIPEKTDIRIWADSGTNNTGISAGFDLILIAN